MRTEVITRDQVNVGDDLIITYPAKAQNVGWALQPHTKIERILPEVQVGDPVTDPKSPALGRCEVMSIAGEWAMIKSPITNMPLVRSTSDLVKV